MSAPTVRLRLDFGPGRALGPGKVDLLEALAETGSLSAAARALRMSYRRAWLLLQSVNALFGEPLAVASKGGRGGGGATLTPRGRRTIAAYRRAEREAMRAAVRAFGAKVAPRRAAPARAAVKRLSRTAR